MRGCPSSFCFPQRKGGLPSLPPADSAGAVPGGVAGGRLPAAPAIPAPAGGLAFLLARLPCLHLFFCPHPPDPLPGGKGETKVIFMQGASPLASPGAGRDAALKVGGMRRPAGACPGRHGQVNSGSPNPAEAAKPILKHPTSQPPCRSAGKGRNRARTPDSINHNLFGKVLGGLGDSFKSPPALPLASPHSPALQCGKASAGGGFFSQIVDKREKMCYNSHIDRGTMRKEGETPCKRNSYRAGVRTPPTAGC